MKTTPDDLGNSPFKNGHAHSSNGANGDRPRNGRNKSMLTRIKSLFTPRRDSSLREAIEELIEDTEHAAATETDEGDRVDNHEKALISNILNLRDLPVIDVMVPRADIFAVDIDTPPKELVSLLAEKPHSRLPVYENDLDNVIGSVHMKDVVAAFAENGQFELRELLRNVLIVSPSMRVMDLLLQMRQSRVHLALVVDEFGGIDGLITINDLIEAIVGEIDDEHDFEIQPQLIERPDGTVLVDARFEVEEFEEKYGILFEPDDSEDIDTLGGLVNSFAGHLPSRGEIIKYDNGLEFEILDADPRRIKRMRIRHLQDVIENRDNQSDDD